MTSEERASCPNEIERRKLDDHTIQSVYQAGYSLITVKSVFGSNHNYPDLLYQIILRKLNTASTS